MTRLRPDLWQKIRDNKGGVTNDEAVILFGREVDAESASDPLATQGGRASVALTKHLENVAFADRSNGRSLFPQLYKNKIRERALLAQLGDGTFWPLAHINAEGYHFLDETEAIKSVTGRENQVPPPGAGFVDPSLAGRALATANRGAIMVTDAFNQPIIRATITVATVGLMTKGLYDLWQRYKKTNPRKARQ